MLAAIYYGIALFMKVLNFLTLTRKYGSGNKMLYILFKYCMDYELVRLTSFFHIQNKKVLISFLQYKVSALKVNREVNLMIPITELNPTQSTIQGQYHGGYHKLF